MSLRQKVEMFPFVANSLQGLGGHHHSPHLSMLPKDDKEQKDTRKSTRKDKDLVNKSGGKAREKRPNGKVQDKHNNLVLFDKATYDKFCKESPAKAHHAGCGLREIQDPWVPGQEPCRSSWVNDLSNWFQSTEFK